MKEKRCPGCGAEIIRIKIPFQRRSIPVNAEPLWIKKDPTGSTFVCETGAFVIGFSVGDSYDNTDTIVLAYDPHLPHCPSNGRAPRKPRNRAKHDIQY